ncbi:hypothetical protein E2320_017291 [Naja naja]|nr:hypothetical protein E2320_017291 [Naja naja]
MLDYTDTELISRGDYESAAAETLLQQHCYGRQLDSRPPGQSTPPLVASPFHVSSLHQKPNATFSFSCSGTSQPSSLPRLRGEPSIVCSPADSLKMGHSDPAQEAGKAGKLQGAKTSCMPIAADATRAMQSTCSLGTPRQCPAIWTWGAEATCALHCVQSSAAR